MIFACSQTPEEKGTGYLTLNISQGTGTKADVDIVDFILRISDGQVDVIKERIGDLPAEIALPEGIYSIEAYSMEFDKPEFDMPFFSGKTTVAIEAGETKEVSLVCSQGNAGIKVVWSGLFSSLFKTYYAQIECNEGYLHYSSTETRTGYFLPGSVSISILADGLGINGGTYQIAAKDMVTAYLQTSYVENPSGGLTIEITIDDTVNEHEIEVTVDPDDFTGANSKTNPYSVDQAITPDRQEKESEVWVAGYIVGSINSTSNYNFADPENWRDTNIVLADDIDETDSYKVIFVNLGSLTSTYRTNLDLTNEDNKDKLHRKVLLKGDLLQYQSRPGLRNLTGGFSFPDE